MKRTSPRRPLELVAACEDRRGKEGLHIAVTISVQARGMERKTWSHDGTVEGLANAWDQAGRWIRAGGQ